MTTATKSAFARRHSVNRSTVNKWEARGHIVMTVDGLVNIEASERLLSERPANYRGGTTKGSGTPQPQPAKVAPEEPTDLVVAALGLIVREIGACAASRAVEFGASLKTAYALDTALCIDATDIGERFLRSRGIPGFENGMLLEMQGRTVTEADWPALADQAGEPLDLYALEDWFCRLPNFQPPEAKADQ
jgi:hypothetical protein